jgi:hypothetical protein
MAFMRAAVSDTKDYFLISEDLEESVFCKWNGIDLPVGEYREDDDPLEDEEMQEQVDGVFKEYSIKQFEIIYAFHGLLEAPGYMDQTDYFFGDSRAEVAEQLIDLLSSLRDKSVWTKTNLKTWPGLNQL